MTLCGVNEKGKKKVLTPTDEKEDPFSKLISGIGHYNGSVEVTSFNKHPEKVGHHKVVVYCCD